MPEVATGFMLGVAFYHLLIYYAAMVRPCCREHYATHPKESA